MAHVPGPYHQNGMTEIVTPDGQLLASWQLGTPAYRDDLADTMRLFIASPELLEASVSGNEVEYIYISELQRIAGPDATLSDAFQSRLHTLI